MDSPRGLRPTLVAGLVCLVVLGLVWGRQSYLVGSAWWVLRWPLGLTGLWLLVSAFRRRLRVMAAAASVTLVLASLDVVSNALASARPETGNAGPFAVVTHNLLFKGNDLDASLEGMLASAPDVIALQELTPADATRLLSALEARYPFHALAPHAGAYGYGLFSKFPLTDVQLVRTSAVACAQCATVTLDDGPLPLCNVHLASPAKELATLQTDLLEVGALEVNARRRRVEWLAVEAELDRRGSSRSRAMALGDFNSLEVEPLYRDLRRGWVDAFRATHLDWGATWPNTRRARPFARLDYVFTRGLTPVSSQVVPNSGSDHLAVAATLAH